jgi:hypothetical protein
MSSLALKCLSIINCSPWVSYIYEKHWNVQQDLMQTYAKRLEEGKARKYVDLGLIASEFGRTQATRDGITGISPSVVVCR